jgi:nucleoside-diphosphate-sugar epimerase
MKKLALVTGHLGFIGSHLVRALSNDYTVAGFDLKDGVDICNQNFINGYDRVFHLAAQTDAQNTNAMADAYTNIFGTLNLLKAYGSKVVFASSSMVNQPECPYAISKRAAEDYARLYGAAIVRLCNIWGNGGHSVIDKFRASDRIEIRGNGEQKRTYAHVSTAVQALIAAQPGTTTILKGTDYTVNELASQFPGKKQVRVPAAMFDPMEVTQ